MLLSGWIKCHLWARTSTCGNLLKCPNLKHLVMVPGPLRGSLHALWINSSKMVLDSPLFCLYLHLFRLRRMSASTVGQTSNNAASALTPQAHEKREAILLVLAFAAVYVIWGSTYLAIAVGIESFPPLLLAALRHLIAGLVLYPLLAGKPEFGQRLPSGAPPSSLVSFCSLLVTAECVCPSGPSLPG